MKDDTIVADWEMAPLLLKSPHVITDPLSTFGPS